MHPLTNSFESKASLCSIIQNTGYAGLRELSQNTNPVNTELLVRNDGKRTRRSREKIVDTKKKNAPSKSFLCSKASNMSIHSQE